MKTISLSIAACAVALSAFATFRPAHAQDAPVSGAQGRYEWRPAQQSSPREMLRAPVRTWVPASGDAAKCDRAMMRSKAAECMSRASTPNNG